MKQSVSQKLSLTASSSLEQSCLGSSISLDGDINLKAKSIKMGWAEKWNNFKQKVSDGINDGISFVKEHGHDILDVAGFVPALGAIPDAINGLWYMAEGDWENMGWSFVSAIPELGDALGLANKSRKVVKGLDLLDKGTDAVKIAKKADKVSDAVELAKKAGKMETGAEAAKNFFKKKKEQLKELWENITRKNKKNCGSGRGTCFPSDTPILTKEGYIPIQNIQAGDDIYSREERTGETGFQKVEEVFLRSVHTIYTIEVNTTTKIQTTSRHPFYVEGEGWVIANQLQVGMNLQTLNGTAVITNLKKERTDEVIPVYNFRVSEWSSYFVSEWNVYVHNGKGYKGNGETEKNITADELVELAKNSKEIDGLSGKEVDVNTALEAGQKFVGKGYKTSMEKGMIKYISKDGTKRFRLKNKIKKADYEANYEVLKDGKAITNYHVVVKQN